jgi:hypothetical protein
MSMTIKIVQHIGVWGGVHNLLETIDEAKKVICRPGKESMTGHPCVTYWQPGSNDAIDVFDGTIYVMNSNGKTVADYHLDNEP